MNVNKRKLILVSNDDGVDAKGLKSLVDIAMCFCDVFVVAPEKAQSGMSHSISLTSPLRTRYVERLNNKTVCAVSGTPVDCIKLGINQLLPQKPDLMLSGINHGSNSAISLIYSGTMGAAIEASLYGIPSIGFSVLDHSPNADFRLVEEYAPKLIRKVIENGIPNQVALNVNFPLIEMKNFAGFKVCKQTKGIWKEDFEKRIDPHGNDYFWLTGSFFNQEIENHETDEWALKNNFASIVPVKIDFTEYNTLNNLKAWNI